MEDWKETAQDRGAWRCFMMVALTDLNDHIERQEKERKDVRKKRRGVLSESLALKCEETGCGFVGQSRSGLVNHVRQRHGRMARVMEKCPVCGERFCKQGFHMHKQFCQANLNRDSANKWVLVACTALW